MKLQLLTQWSNGMLNDGLRKASASFISNMMKLLSQYGVNIYKDFLYKNAKKEPKALKTSS